MVHLFAKTLQVHFASGNYPGRAVSFSLHVQTRAREIFCVISSDWLQFLIHIHEVIWQDLADF